MAILKIARMGNPVLRMVAETIPLEHVADASLQRLIDDMLETVGDERGAGLAAPQVHVSKRVVVVRLDDDADFEVWINPQITPLTDSAIITFEGCLSIPGLRGAVARPERVCVTGIFRDGTPFEYILEDFPAVVAQHECDHLDGVLYIDRADPTSLAFIEEHHKYSHLVYPDNSNLPVGNETDTNETEQ